MQGLAALPQITCNQPLLENALPLFVKNTKLSFEDCCLVIYAKIQNALPLWTFDHKLASQIPSTKLITAK